MNGYIVSRIALEHHKFQTYCILKTLFVDGVGKGCYLACYGIVQRIEVAFYDIDAVPTLGNGFLPLCNFLCKTVVVVVQLCSTLCLLVVELSIVVVQLTLHRVMRRDCGD